MARGPGGARREERGFGGVDGRVRARVVPVPGEEGGGPRDTEQAEEEERGAPVHVLEAEVDEQRRRRAPPAGAHPEQALCPRPLVRRQPAVQGLGEVREAAGLARAEEEPRRHQREPAPRPAGRHGEERPPQDDPQEHLARADAVAEIARGNLEEGVRQREGGEHVAHLPGRKTEVLRDERRGLGDAHPVDVLDHRQGDRETDDPVARAGGLGRRRRRGVRAGTAHRASLRLWRPRVNGTPPSSHGKPERLD